MDRKENNIGSDTIVFSIKNSKDSEMKRILTTVYDALVEKGYDPLNQIVGYILSVIPVISPITRMQELLSEK